MSLGLASLARPGWLAVVLARAEGALLAQRGHLFPWVPVCLGGGIALYLGALQEPGPSGWAAIALLGGLLALLAARRVDPVWAPPFLALVAAGAGLGGLRVHAVAAPVLPFRYYGPVEGRIVEVDRSSSDTLRLTLDRVVLEDVAPSRTPARVRVSLHGDQRWLDPEPGRVVMLPATSRRPRARPSPAASTSAAWLGSSAWAPWATRAPRS